MLVRCTRSTRTLVDHTLEEVISTMPDYRWRGRNLENRRDELDRQWSNDEHTSRPGPAAKCPVCGAARGQPCNNDPATTRSINRRSAP